MSAVYKPPSVWSFGCSDPDKDGVGGRFDQPPVPSAEVLQTESPQPRKTEPRGHVRKDRTLNRKKHGDTLFTTLDIWSCELLDSEEREAGTVKLGTVS